MPDKTEGESAAPHDPYAALRFRDFRFLLLSNFLGTIGGQMADVAIGWHVYTLTHSAFALGLVGLVEILPVILFALPAGHLSDQYSRKKIVLVARSCNAVCSVGLAFLSFFNGPIYLLYTLILCIGIARSFFGPASSTLVAQVVPPSVFTNAVNWRSNIWQLAAAIGPALGGFVIAVSKSVTPAYMLDVLFSIIYVCMIASIRSSQPVRPREPLSLESLGAGIRFMRSSPLLLSAITLDLFAVLLGGAAAMLPVFAKDILHVGPTGFGWLRAAPSIGATVMAFIIAHRRPSKHAGKTLLWAVAGFGVATIVFGLSKSFLLSLAMLFSLGALDSVSVVIRSALLLVTAPDAMRGRVSAVNSIFVGASNELGAFESGTVAAWLGVVPSVVLGGIGTIIVVIASALIWPQLRNLKEIRPSEEEETPVSDNIE